MNLRQIAVKLLIMLNFVTAVHAADFQQIQLKGPKNASNQFSGKIYGPIESSDTLWQISQRYRQNNTLSIYQVMQAIYELNPDSFEQQNINLLKNGKILRLPSERYIARVSSQQAKEKSERDAQNLQTRSSSLSSGAASQDGSDLQAAATLEQTNELIEQKLSAIDEAQNRQFMAIRNQFAGSIDSVQSILDENKKLFERLDKVNTDIDEMRSDEQQKSLQMNQMGESIDELLKKSRQDDAEKAARLAKKTTSVFDHPVILTLVFTLPVVLILSIFAYWMIKRKQPEVFQPEENDEVDASLDPIAAEMDDLSDALSAELSRKTDDMLNNDDLFGDADLADDEITQRLVEPLKNSPEQPLSDEGVIFDELGDDALDDLLVDEFEVGDSVVEQDDLDSLFDEDELLADVEQEISAEADLVDDLSAVEQDPSDYDNIPIQEDEQQATLPAQDMGTDKDELPLAPITTDDETALKLSSDDEHPEISIDELLDISADDVIENPIIVSSEDINEEVLQNLDKEIVSQNEELDNVTGRLIDELEQVEQMRSMMPEFDEQLSAAEDPQLGIQKLDGLAQEINDDLLADGSTNNDIDNPEASVESALIDDSEAMIKPESLDNTEALVEPAPLDNTEALIEPAPLDNAEALIEPASIDDSEALVEPAPLDNAEALVEPAPLDNAETLVEPAPLDNTEALVESELQVDNSFTEEDELDSKVSSASEFDVPASSNSALDEDQLEKALEDFEKEELDEVLGDLVSNETASISPLDDLTLSADEFFTKDQSIKGFSTHTPTPTLDDMESIDDDELYQAFDDNINELSNDSSQNRNDELDDLPKLGDWLDDVKPVKQQISASQDKDIIEELEESNFDEMLESMDLDDGILATEVDDTGFDIATLLDETSKSENIDFNEQDIEDFLDVEALLNESVGAESDDDIERALDLDIPLEPYVNEQDNLEMIDVDADDGLGAKLDLAHAYIEIGEEESAKALLDEVLQKGNKEQIAQANTILNQME